MQRFMISLPDEMRIWLEKKSEETGATIAGVIRTVIKKEIERDAKKN